MRIDVAFLPQALADRELGDTTCIVLDVFRATSCMITALEHGCRAIVPVSTVAEARMAAEQFQNKPCLLAGERKGIRVEGFELGNSLQEFTGERIKNQLIVMSTTNGTVAVKAVQRARAILIGAFLNANAVCERAKCYANDILIVCAGTDRKVSLEDALCAGLLIDILGGGEAADLTDAARAALLMYTQTADVLDKVAADSNHGRYLHSIGFAEDVRLCTRINTVEIVPECRQGKIAVPEFPLV